MLGAGCSTVSPEPESTYQDFPPQAYPFDTVWECAIEASEELGFHIEDSSRDGQSGFFVTNVVEVDKDLVRRTRLGHRVRGKISPNGDQTFRLQLAASRFEEQEGEAWSYLTADAELLSKFESTYKRRLSARYEPVGGN
ncbi:MAG: hypothetical protein R3F62_10300 [Planctomycetota bacterium]